MDYLNYGAALLFLAALIYFAYLAFTRNKSVRVKAFNDPFAVIIAAGLWLIIFPFNPQFVTIEVVRDSVFFLAILATFMVRKGFSDDAVVLLLNKVPYTSVKRIEILSYNTSTVQIYVITDGRNYKLYLRQFRLPAFLALAGEKFADVKIEEKLNEKLMRGDFCKKR